MRPSTLVLIVAGCIYGLAGCGHSECQDPIWTPLKDKALYVPYKGSEQLRFLHNNVDTHVFVSQGLIEYTRGIESMNENCPAKHEAVAVQFLNTTTLEPLFMRYEWDRDSFPPETDPIRGSRGPHEFYKISFRNKLFYRLVYDSYTTSVTINKVGYDNVVYVGKDTTDNYVAVRFNKGILSMAIEGEKWELIP